MVVDRRSFNLVIPASATISVDSRDGRTVVVVSGEIDVANSDSLLDAILAQSKVGRDLTVDLASVSFIDSSGLGALAEVNRRCRADGVGLFFVVGNPNVRRVLSVSGLDKILQLAGD